MSASLVGSEMCIRDRVSGGHRGSKRCVLGLLGRGRGRQREVAPGRFKHCLLYTSDAADDM
eukprot:8428259-Alexandrium_andersonii.AAC.1